MQFSRTVPLRRLVRDLGLSSEHKKNEIAILQKNMQNNAELCKNMHLVVGLQEFQPNACTTHDRMRVIVVIIFAVSFVKFQLKWLIAQIQSSITAIIAITPIIALQRLTA
jgi:hypothetical protein